MKLFSRARLDVVAQADSGNLEGHAEKVGPLEAKNAARKSAPPMGIPWNHIVPVFSALAALTGGMNTFNHIVTGIP